MSESTSEAVKSIGMRDSSLFRQQVYINGKWSDADNGESNEKIIKTLGNQHKVLDIYL